jgi:steroid 5-alpha reductase family enzyme
LQALQTVAHVRMRTQPGIGDSSRDGSGPRVADVHFSFAVKELHPPASACDRHPYCSMMAVRGAFMPIIVTLAILLAGLVLVFSVAWFWQLRTENAGMVDPVWAATLGAAALFIAAAGTGEVRNRAFVAVAGAAWGARLGWHLWRRNHGKPEDPRYHAFRERWGDKAARNMFWFFQLQALISMLLAIAFLVPAYARDAAKPMHIAAAIAIWIIAVVGEARADRQLKRFAADPAHRGKVCRDGLWRYSRHPNYFFECVHWVAYLILSIGLPFGWTTLAPPLLMAWLLVKVSGIPLLEARLAQTRDGYRDYMRTTSVLIPWPPKRA